MVGVGMTCEEGCVAAVAGHSECVVMPAVAAALQWYLLQLIEMVTSSLEGNNHKNHHQHDHNNNNNNNNNSNNARHPHHQPPLPPFPPTVVAEDLLAYIVACLEIAVGTCKSAQVLTHTLSHTLPHNLSHTLVLSQIFNLFHTPSHTTSLPYILASLLITSLLPSYPLPPTYPITLPHPLAILPLTSTPSHPRSALPYQLAQLIVWVFDEHTMARVTQGLTRVFQQHHPHYPHHSHNRSSSSGGGHDGNGIPSSTEGVAVMLIRAVHHIVAAMVESVTRGMEEQSRGGKTPSHNTLYIRSHTFIIPLILLSQTLHLPPFPLFLPYTRTPQMQL